MQDEKQLLLLLLLLFARVAVIKVRDQCCRFEIMLLLCQELLKVSFHLGTVAELGFPYCWLFVCLSQCMKCCFSCIPPPLSPITLTSVSDVTVEAASCSSLFQGMKQRSLDPGPQGQPLDRTLGAETREKRVDKWR